MAPVATPQSQKTGEATLALPLLAVDTSKRSVSKWPLSFIQTALLAVIVACPLLAFWTYPAAAAPNHPQTQGGPDHSHTEDAQAEDRADEAQWQAAVEPRYAMRAGGDPHAKQRRAPTEAEPRDGPTEASGTVDRVSGATGEPGATQHQMPTAAEPSDVSSKATGDAEKNPGYGGHDGAAEGDRSAPQPKSGGKTGNGRVALGDVAPEATADDSKRSKYGRLSAAGDRGTTLSDSGERGGKEVDDPVAKQQPEPSTQQHLKKSQADRQVREQKVEEEVAGHEQGKDKAVATALAHHSGIDEQRKTGLNPKEEQRDITKFEAKVIADGLICTHPRCDQGHCDQTGCFQPTCNGGGCIQIKTFEASCRGGKCSQGESLRPQCEGGSCVQV